MVKKNGTNNKPKEPNEEVICYYCKSPGHYATDCPLRESKEQMSKGSNHLIENEVDEKEVLLDEDELIVSHNYYMNDTDFDRDNSAHRGCRKICTDNSGVYTMPYMYTDSPTSTILKEW